MSDLPNLDAARAALAATLLPASTFTTYRAIGECGHDLGYSSPTDNYNRRRPLWCSDCGGYAGIDEVRAVEMVNHADMSVDAAFLADALAVVDALTARLAEAEAENRRLRDVLGWTNQECPGKCGAAAFDALAAKVTPCPLPCPTCGYNGVPGTTHSTSCLYPLPAHKELTRE